MRRSFVFLLCLCSVVLRQRCRAELDADVFCVQQGFLLLDENTRPRRSVVDWPFCQEYQSCSCCNVSHAMTIRRSMVSDDAALTPCQEALASAACRVCHPEVGTGIIEAVCAHQCDEWFVSCAQDYFAFDTISTRLTLCQHDSQLICTQLGHISFNGTSFCEHLGIRVSHEEDEDCWFHRRAVETVLCDRFPAQPFLTLSDFKYLFLLLFCLLIVWMLPHCRL